MQNTVPTIKKSAQRAAYRSLGTLILSAMLLVACQTVPQSVERSTAPTDPCAEQLHDICGRLLLYYSLNNHLPETLEDLRSVPGDNSNLSFICPLSHKPYIYNPLSISVPGHPYHVIIYDPQPIHSNLRWVIAIDTITPNTPLVTRVVPIPESLFTKALTTP